MGRNSKSTTKRKRKASTTSTSTTTATSNSPNDNNNMWSSSSKKKKGVSYSSGSSSHQHNSYGIQEAEAEKIFQSIAERDDPTVATMEGIGKLCDMIELDPFEVGILVLMWKMGANSKPAQISNVEWLAGCNKLQVDTVEKIKGLKPSLDTGFIEESDFKDFYKFCFQFNREGTHKTLNKDLVVDLLKLVLAERIPSIRLQSFCDFIMEQKSYTKITLDQWTSFLDFCFEFKDPNDLSNYDEDLSAWPILIDDYVKFVQEKH